MFKKVQLTILALMIGNCGPGRTIVMSDSIKNQSTLHSYYLENISLGKTLADSSEISGKMEELRRLVRDNLKENGFKSEEVRKADFTASVLIQTAPTSSISPDELRFMKGAHGTGSNFPDQNPRVRNLEADFLIFSLFKAAGRHLLYQSRCRLLESQNSVDEKIKSRIRIEDAASCIEEISSKLR